MFLYTVLCLYTVENGYMICSHVRPTIYHQIKQLRPTQKDRNYSNMAKITKREIREGLENIPIEQLLLGSVNSRELTHKQKTFAKQVALGKPKTEAYRIAYDTKAKPPSVASDACKLSKNPDISLMIEAYKRAFEAREYQKPERLRELVIHQLTEMALNPEVKDAQRIRSLELLGKVSEVGAFTERKETKVIHESSKIKERLLEQLKTIINVDATELDDGDSLLRELSDGNQAEAESECQDPTTTRPPQIDHAEQGTVIHINPHIQSANLEDSEKSLSQPTDLEEEKSEVEALPPASAGVTNLPKESKTEGVGGTNNWEEGKSENIETPPLSNWKEKG